MALNIDVKFEGKLTCAFINDMRNLTNFRMLKNSNFILEKKWRNKIKIKTQNNEIDYMQCENFILPWKQINSTINKTFYIYSMESLFLRYKKISKKAAKLGSFLQCSVHMFLGHDGCFWKIDLKYLWSHIMKNFQVKHGQYYSIIFPKIFSFGSSK